MNTANDVMSSINKDKQSAAIRLQNAFKNKKAIDEFSTRYADKIIKERTIMNTANDVISKINRDKQSAAIRLQYAFRNKKAIKDKLKEEENKQRQKELYLKYSALYQPKEDITLKIKRKPTEPKFSFENDIKDRQKKIYLKYTEMYQPQNNLSYRP